MCLQHLQVDVPNFEAVFELGPYCYLQISDKSPDEPLGKHCAKPNFREVQ